MTFVGTPLGWHAVSWDGAQALVFTSRVTRWVDVPDNVIMVRQVFREEWKPGNHYSRVFYSVDWIWLRPDGAFDSGRAAPNIGEEAKEGLLIPDETYEALLVGLHAGALVRKTAWSRP